jgi:hypothetical protein
MRSYLARKFSFTPEPGITGDAPPFVIVAFVHHGIRLSGAF